MPYQNETDKIININFINEELIQICSSWYDAYFKYQAGLKTADVIFLISHIFQISRRIKTTDLIWSI